MSQNSNKEKEKILLILGLILIATGILVNRWSLGYFVLPYAKPVKSPSHVLIIVTFQTLTVITGALLIYYRRIITPQLLLKKYQNFSGLFFGFFILFLGLNLFLYSVTTIENYYRTLANPIQKEYQFSFESYYPGWSAGDIAKLQEETWSRKFMFEPFVQFKEGPFDGQHVNVDGEGFRYSNDQAPWPPSPDMTSIFVFGGSTTFGYGVADGDTIVSHLQDMLRERLPYKNIAMYNFGRGFYYSSQERALFEKLLASGQVPDMAIFINGMNEFAQIGKAERPQFTPELEEVFTKERYQNYLLNLPLISRLRSLFSHQSEEPQSQTDESEAKQIQIQGGIHRYVSNKKMIQAASEAFGVEPIFIWQPVPFYKFDLKYHPFSKSRNWQSVEIVGEAYHAMSRYTNQHEMGENFLYLADMQNTAAEPLYVDAVHYTGAMSKEIGTKIFQFVEKYL